MVTISSLEQLKEVIAQYKSVCISISGMKKNGDLDNKEFIDIDSDLLLTILNSFVVLDEPKHKENSKKIQKETNDIVDVALQSMVNSIPSVETLINKSRKYNNSEVQN